MHIHAKPLWGWHPDGIRPLAKAAAVFEDAIAKVMPAERKRVPWARSNFHKIVHSGGPEYERIMDIGPVEKALIARFTPVEKKKKTWQHLFDHIANVKDNKQIPGTLGDHRDVSMNFMPVLGGCGTVEFRRPPGVATAADAQRWAGFALAFVASSLTPAWNTAAATRWAPTSDTATVADLQAFLQQGLTHLAQNTGQSKWKSVMVPKSFVLDTSSPTPLSHYTISVLEAKRRKAAEPGSFEMVRELIFSSPHGPPPPLAALPSLPISSPAAHFAHPWRISALLPARSSTS